MDLYQTNVNTSFNFNYKLKKDFDKNRQVQHITVSGRFFWIQKREGRNGG